MKATVASFIWILLLTTLTTVQFVGLVSGSFQYSITSPENTIYSVNEVPLNISIRTTNGPRMGYSNYVNKIFYCLDGQTNVTVPFFVSKTGDESIEHNNYRASTILSNLSDGDHKVIIYALGSHYSFVVDSLDFAIGYSLNTPEIPTTSTPFLTFAQEHFPTTIALALIATIVTIGIGVLVYHKKKRRIINLTEKNTNLFLTLK